MIRLNGWPQLSTAAAFVTAIAVVLNPITPVLPDVTVPALIPPATTDRLPARVLPEHHAAATTAAPVVPAAAGPAAFPMPNAPAPPPSLLIQPAAPVGPRPLPAAAVGSPDAAGPGAGGVTRQHGRGGAERPDAGGPASRGHRGPADGN